MYMTGFWKLAVSLSQFAYMGITNSLPELEEPSAQAKALSVAVNEIPKAHRDTLQFLVFHLSRVIQHASDNLVCIV